MAPLAARRRDLNVRSDDLFAALLGEIVDRRVNQRLTELGLLDEVQK